MIINKSGLIIRMAVESLRVMGRATQGVRLINLREGDAIAAVARVEVLEGSEEYEGEEEMNGNNEQVNIPDEAGEIEKTPEDSPETD